MHAGYFLTRAAERYPDRAAWIDAHRVITFRQAAARVGGLASGLLSMGGQPGDRVGLLTPNCAEGLEAILAPMQAGMAVVPMNVRLHADEHAFMLNDSGCFALIYAEELRSHVDRIRERLTTVEHFVCIGRPAGGELAYDALVEQGAPSAGVAIEPDDLAWIFYTSGTTGHPKGAMLTHRVLIGKVLKREPREPYWAGRTRRI